jgi:chaperonin GroES
MYLHEAQRLFLPTYPPQSSGKPEYVGRPAEGRVIGVQVATEERSVLLTDEQRGEYSPDVVEVIASDHADFEPGDFAVCLPYSGIWYSRPRFAVGVERARVYGFAPGNRTGHRSIDATTQLVATMTKEALRPTGSNVIIRSPKPSDKVGELYVPDKAKASVNSGTIVAVGPGRIGKDGERVPVGRSVGEYVLAFDTSNAVSFEEDGEIVTIVDVEAIQVVV